MLWERARKTVTMCVCASVIHPCIHGYTSHANLQSYRSTCVCARAGDSVSARVCCVLMLFSFHLAL